MPYDMKAIFDEVVGEQPTAVQTQPIPAQPTPPVTAPKPDYDMKAIFDEVVGPRDPNAPDPNKVFFSLSDAANSKPEEVARRSQIAEKLGTDPALLPPTPEAEAMLKRKETQDLATSLVAKSPKTANLLTVPNTAKMVGTAGAYALGKLEESMTKGSSDWSHLARAWASAFPALAGIGAKLASEVLSGLGLFQISDQDIVETSQSMEELTRRRGESKAFLGQYARRKQAESEAILAGDTPEQKARWQAVEYATLDPNKSVFLNEPVKVVSDVLTSLPTIGAMVATFFFARGAGMREYEKVLAADPLATKAAREAYITAAGDAASKVGRISQGALAYGQNSLSTGSDIEKMLASEIAKNPQWQADIARGKDPELIKALAAVKGGELSGILSGYTTGVTEGISGRYLAKILAPGPGEASRLMRIGEGWALGSATEALQSAPEAVAENVAVKAYADPTREMSEKVLERTVQGFALGGLVEGPLAGLGRGRQAQQAVTDRDTLNKLAIDAASNPVRENAPEAYRNFIDSLTEGRSVREVYIDTNIIRDVFAQAGVTERELSTVFPDVAAQLADETNTDGFVKIPTSDLITKIKTPEILKSVLDNARVWNEGEATPGPSFMEAETFFQKQHEEFKKESITAAERKARDDQHEADMREIRRVIADEIFTTGRYDKTVAATHAIPLAQFYEQRAKDFNGTVTAKQLFEQYPYQAQNEAGKNEKITYLAETTEVTPTVKGESSKVFTAQATTESEPKVKQQLMQDEKGNYVWQKYQKDQAKKLTTPEGAVLTPATFKTEADLQAAIKANPLIVKRNLVAGKGGTFKQEGLAKPPSIPEQFYSQLRKVLNDAPDKVFTSGEQLKKWLSANAGKLGVKKDEIFWSGINEWLDMQDKVSKADVLAFLDGNGVKVEVKVLGESLGLSPTKFSGYKLPGGTNYREMLLKLPTPRADRLAKVKARIDEMDKTIKAFTPENKDEFKRLLDEEKSLEQTKPEFRSAHWEDANIAAHIRMNDRVGANGERVLFVEEVQSDWGQKGKKEGFAEKITKWPVEYSNGAVVYYASEAKAKEMAAKNNGTATKPHEVKGTPSAPFVTDTKAWTTLAMKHVIQEAVSGGYDSVAWTTGEQQAERYDLSKQVKEIVYAKGDDGLDVLIDALRPDGGELFHRKVTMQELPDVVGKEVAQKIQDGPRTGKLSGLDLKVGGEGMKGYYDGILPQVVSGIFKQLKVEGKVESVEIDVGIETEQPSFTISPELAAKVKAEGMPFFQGINAEFDRTTLMSTFLKDANLSSIIHESGHFYLEVMERLANRPDAPQKIKDDFNLFMNWFGVTPEQWAGIDNAARTPYHEQFAQSQELWMLEGKSPTLDKKTETAFARFRSWMLSVYKSVEQFLQQNPLAGKLNDEVRAAFSRLIASEDAIKEAEKIRGYVPLFQTAEEAGVSQDVFDGYLAELEDATQQSVDAVQKRSMRDLKWLSNAKSATLKKIQSQAEDFRATIREEVTAQVMAEPVNRARQAMLNGEVKMSAEELGAMVTDPSVAGMVAEDGLPLDMVASQFGFPSSEALLQELVRAENAQEKIDGITDQRMLQEHGEMVDARAIDEAVNAALVNDSRARFYASGLKILTKSGAPISQITKAAKMAAETRIAKIPLKELRPAYYAGVERKAALKAVELAGKDPAGAVKAQRAAILNNQLHKAALAAKEEIAKAEAHLSRITKPGAQKAMGGEHLLQLNALLSRLGITSKATLLTETNPRQDFSTYLDAEAKRLSAIAPDVPAWLISEQVTREYKTLTLAEFRDVMGAVKSIEMLARREREQYAAFRGETFADAKAKNMEVFRKNFPKLFLPNGQLKPPVTDPRNKMVSNVGDALDDAQAALSSSEAIVSLFEGGKIGDLFYSLIWPMSSRNDWKVNRMEQVYETVQPLFDQYSIAEQIAFTRKDIGTKTLGFVLTRESAITIALYHGSETGRDRLANHTLTNGQRLDVATQQKVIDLLDARDIKLVNGIWKLFDQTLWPELKALDERTKGKSAPKVEAMPHTAKNGQLTGGYYEIKYDTEKGATPGSEADAVAEMMSGNASGRRVATSQGSSIAREEHTEHRPRLDLGVFFETVNKVVNDLAYREAVADTQRMLLDPEIETVIKTAGSEAEYKALKHRMGAMVMGSQIPSGVFEKGADLARKNTSVVLLSGIWTGLQNYTNLSSVARYLGVANVAIETLKMHSPMGPAAFRFGMKHSTFLRNYHLSFDRTLQENAKKLTSKQSYMPNMSTWLWFMGKINQIVASITWNAAYKVAMKENNNDHGVAVIHADRMTRKLVGSGRDADVTKMAEGHWLPLLNMMYSFFNSQLMLMMEETTLLKRTLKNDEETAAFKAKALALYAKSWLMIVAIPAVLGDMALGALRGDPDKDDEDKLTHYLKVIGLYNIAFIPGGGSVGAFLYRKGLGMESYGLKISPVEAAITGVATGVGSAVDIWNDEGDIKDVGNEIMALSYMLGLPGSFVKNAVVGGVAYANDQAGPEALLFGPPKEPRSQN